MSSPAVAAPRPAGPTRAQVAQVRAFNRFYTNVIGVLHDMYLDTPYTLTESRVLFEIARLGTVEVSWLRQALDIDPGYLSRVLGRFESRRPGDQAPVGGRRAAPGDPRHRCGPRRRGRARRARRHPDRRPAQRRRLRPGA